MTTMDAAPLSVIYDLSRLSEGGTDLTITATAAQRSELAKWAGISSVGAFEAKVALRRQSAARFTYEATVSVDLVQTCVVTLEPVPSHLNLEISRELHLIKFPAKAQIATDELAPAADEGPEEIRDSHYDLSGPLLEEFSLAIDPYPRAPGVAFESPQEIEPPENPFAVLKQLKSDV
jgi:uncharacterized metal-binding protein YceD (DUF177 family)